MVFRVLLAFCGLCALAFAASPPGPGPFGNVVLAQPVSGAQRAQKIDGWKEGKVCEIDEGQNNTNATEALQAAIDDCGDREEGGTVLVRNSLHLWSASLWLRSNLTFRVEEGSSVTSTATGVGKKTDPSNVNCTDAPIVYTRRESIMMDAHAGFLNAGRFLSDDGKWTTLENVVVEGGGLLDADGDAWYDKSDPDFVTQMRPMMLDLLWVRGLTIRDVQLRRPGFWTVHPTFCDNVVVANNSIVTYGSNTDGCDPDSCWNVYIAGNDFDNGDDCIAVKAGRDASGREVNISTRNVLAEFNHFKSGHGVSIGSETSGWVLDVVIRNSILDGTNKAVRIKSARGRGGGVRNATYSNLTGSVKYAVSLSLDYEGDLPPTNDSATPEIHDVIVRDLDLVVTESDKAADTFSSSSSEPNDLECIGLSDSPITGVTFRNVKVAAAESSTLDTKCTYCFGTSDDDSDPTPCFEEEEEKQGLPTGANAPFPGGDKPAAVTTAKD